MNANRTKHSELRWQAAQIQRKSDVRISRIWYSVAILPKNKQNAHWSKTTKNELSLATIKIIFWIHKVLTRSGATVKVLHKPAELFSRCTTFLEKQHLILFLNESLFWMIKNKCKNCNDDYCLDPCVMHQNDFHINHTVVDFSFWHTVKQKQNKNH